VERQTGDDQGTNEQHNLATCRMQNKLKEFEELLLDNTLFKVQNQVVGDINPKWKEWW
jgi:NADH:ubiquinone oxidoreductase subunit D